MGAEQTILEKAHAHAALVLDYVKAPIGNVHDTLVRLAHILDFLETAVEIDRVCRVGIIRIAKTLNLEIDMSQLTTPAQFDAWLAAANTAAAALQTTITNQAAQLATEGPVPSDAASLTGISTLSNTLGIADPTQPATPVAPAAPAAS